MRKRIVLNCTPEETRVAVLEGNLLAEIYIERAGDRSLVGNVYKGRVQRVLPGMQAAFVDIGFEKAAFLHASDTHVRPDDGFDADEAVEVSRRQPIEKKLSAGQEIVVQVAKEPIGSKGARVTSQVSLAGRYLVYVPGMDRIGISRRIADEEERQRLRELVAAHRPERGGFIVRTLCEGVAGREIEADADYLIRLWTTIDRKADAAKAPAIVHSEIDQVQRTIRDLFGPDIGRIHVDSEQEYRRIVDVVSTLAPHLKGRVELYEADEPIFERFAIEAQIEKALDRRVWLKSGGYLVIDETEALTTIDVNTGRYVGKGDQEETILRTNLEAADEIIRQLKLRQIGGLVILDLIDMESEANRRKVYEAIQEAVRARDKAQSRILQISELGLVEMTRKRTRESLGRTLCSPCPHCDGLGRLKSAETISYEILRRLRWRRRAAGRTIRILVRAHPDVTKCLRERESHALDDLEQSLGTRIVIKSVETLAPETYEIVGAEDPTPT